MFCTAMMVLFINDATKWGYYLGTPSSWKISYAYSSITFCFSYYFDISVKFGILICCQFQHFHFIDLVLLRISVKLDSNLDLHKINKQQNAYIPMCSK